MINLCTQREKAKFNFNYFNMKLWNNYSIRYIGMQYALYINYIMQAIPNQMNLKPIILI